MIHLDSSYLIDLGRETERGQPGPALDFAESLDSAEILAVSVHVLAELRAGAELAKKPLATHQGLDDLLSGFLIVYPDDRFPKQYARLFAATSRVGRKLASMDLLIATAAIIDDAPLVTADVKDFSRVPGLRVLGY